MQRKLSEIAEIPKILSSTLATVSQTFHKYVPSDAQELKRLARRGALPARKYSYDEDAIDYELSDKDAQDNDEKHEQEQQQQTALYTDAGGDCSEDDASLNSGKYKDITPESDYASEANYVESSDEADETDDTDNGEYYDAIQNVYNVTKAVEQDDAQDSQESGGDEDDESIETHYYVRIVESNNKKQEYDEDFLTTSYTWNLRNVPKLKLNDEEPEEEKEEGEEEAEAEADAEEQEEEEKVLEEFKEDDMLFQRKSKEQKPKEEKEKERRQTKDEDEDEQLLRIEQSLERLKRYSRESSREATPVPEIVGAKQIMPQLSGKFEKFERSWPWADPKKIIYKQSTCHLVPRKPLGIIEKSIQQLNKQHFLDKLGKLAHK